MKFVIPFFNHQNGKVRNLASSLVAEVSIKIGFNNEEFNKYIKDLNPQILNVIKAKSNTLKNEKNNSLDGNFFFFFLIYYYFFFFFLFYYYYFFFW